MSSGAVKQGFDIVPDLAVGPVGVACLVVPVSPRIGVGILQSIALLVVRLAPEAVGNVDICPISFVRV